MEQTGSPEYKVRRMKHWFRKNWMDLSPKIQIFDEASSDIKREILKAVPSIQHPIIVYFESKDHWALLQVNAIAYKHASKLHLFYLDDISDTGYTWGGSTAKEQEDRDHKIKRSAWLYIRNTSAQQFDLQLGDAKLVFLNAISKLNQLGQVE